MAVKDLIQLFEPPRSHSLDDHGLGQSPKFTPTSAPQPSPVAGFPSQRRSESGTFPSAFKLKDLKGDEGSCELEEISGSATTFTSFDAGKSHANWSDTTTFLTSHHRSHSSTTQRRRSQGRTYGSTRHAPVPATTVFARNAYPLHLPDLDNYLATLPPPSLSGLIIQPEAMFPPMDLLAKSGRSIDDLEANAKQTPVWRNRRTLLGSAVNIILGFTGSSALASFYSLQGVFNTVQIFALILSTIIPIKGRHLEDKWRQLFFGTIPNVLALNFASTLAQSLWYLLVFMTIAAGLLYYFYRFAIHCDRYEAIEGFQGKEPEGNQWGLVIVTFLLTVIYLPLSTMAVHVLVWSEDLWIVPNPYINSTSSPPFIPPLGRTNEYRDPLDFCWTTTMKRNQINYAPFIILVAAIVFVFLTVWFPLGLRRVIQQSVPKVDKYTELGRLRSSTDLDSEYHRMLSRDKNPFAFLYSGFRRGWGTYESTYLFAKLSTLIIIAILDPDNCFFRGLDRARLLMARQILLFVSAASFFVMQCFFAPFLDPVNNASEWTSRLNYVTTSLVALLVTLKIPNQDILDTYILYTIYVLTYGLSFYFTIINVGLVQRAVKRLNKRIDFSIDVFSPRLDISTFSIHTKRRIWQESITTLLLTDPDCAIPSKQRISFSQARDSEYPPYLLNFSGTPSERHVENIKILREVGNLAYCKALTFSNGPDRARLRQLETEIQRNFIGPDCYWNNPSEKSARGCSNFFGNAWWIPFPPTLIIRYDDGPISVLKDILDFEKYIMQNSSPDIRRKRFVRMSLRALEGQVVSWPYKHKEAVGSRWGSITSLIDKSYRVDMTIQFKSCLFLLHRQGHLEWHGVKLGSGFKVELRYTRGIKLSGDVIGLDDDYDLTPTLAQFLKLNECLIPKRLENIEDALYDYRRHRRLECQLKRRALTYRFLSSVYDQPPCDAATLIDECIATEADHRIHKLMQSSRTALQAAHCRFQAVSNSESATWWYIFWDDLWRRNFDTIAGLERHAADFNPHYPTSIAYYPLPRAALESFLAQRGLYSKARSRNFFTSGFLNKIYARMNDIVFRGSGRAIMFHIGGSGPELDMDDVDLQTQGRRSTPGTGGGTDHNLSWIRSRPTYRWEGLLSDPPVSGVKLRQKLFAKVGAWMGLTPLWRAGTPSKGLYLDVHVEDGRYVVMNEQYCT